MYVHCAVVSAGLKQQPLAMQRNLQFRSPALGMKHVRTAVGHTMAVSVSFRIAHSSHRSPSASLPAHRLQCRASASHWSAVAHGHESAAAIRWAHCTIRQLWERTVGLSAQSPGPRVRTASGAGPALMLPFHRGTDQTVEGPHSLMRASVALDSGIKSLSSLRTICILSRSVVV